MGGATKISVCFNGIKSVNINLIARLSVVYLTICILHFTNIPESLNLALSQQYLFFLKMLSAFLVCCIHSNKLQTRYVHGAFFMEDNVTEEQPNLGPYCLQYKLHNKINSKLHKNINRLKGSRIMVH